MIDRNKAKCYKLVVHLRDVRVEHEMSGVPVTEYRDIAENALDRVLGEPSRQDIRGHDTLRLIQNRPLVIFGWGCEIAF